MATSHSSSGLLPFCIRCPRLHTRHPAGSTGPAPPAPIRTPELPLVQQVSVTPVVDRHTHVRQLTQRDVSDDVSVSRPPEFALRNGADTQRAGPHHIRRHPNSGAASYQL